MKASKKIISLLCVAVLAVTASIVPASATAQSKSKTLPDSYGTLTSNAWRQTGNGTVSGNTLQWDYQVSAVYSGSKTVSRIRSIWQGSASMKNSGSLSLGISNSGVSVGASSSWQTVNTVAKYWENTNGATSSSWRSNMVASPKSEYKSDTISISNTALVQIRGDSRLWEITASA